MEIISIGAAVKKAKEYTDQKIATLGKGMQYKGSVATTSDLPQASNSNKGWLYTITANGHEVVSDGAQWVDLSADLSNYYTKSEIDAKLSTLLTYGGE